MRFTITNIMALLASASAVTANGCNANNCARAVTGTRDKIPSLESRRVDCSSFMLAIITPATVTVTTTISTTTTTSTTSTSTSTSTLPLVPRLLTVIPSQVPIYASACPNAAAYSSACSCWGITASTSTAAAPSALASTTATQTATETVTVTEVATATATDVVCRPAVAECDFGNPQQCCSQACCGTIGGGQPQTVCATLLDGGILDCIFPPKRRSPPVRMRDGKGRVRMSHMKPDGTIEVIDM